MSLCPVCPPGQLLTLQTLEPGLQVRGCTRCGGHWIRLADYWRWRAGKGAGVPEKQVKRASGPAQEAAGYRRCPDDGQLLTRYRVGRGVAFTLERCAQCEGVWLDANEWEVLKRRGLHDDLHRVFSEDWQREARQMEKSHELEALLMRALPPADYVKIREIKAWIDAHPHRNELYEVLGVPKQRPSAPTRAG
jgi:Zn-finger nucleic acid-binding protein